MAASNESAAKIRQISKFLVDVKYAANNLDVCKETCDKLTGLYDSFHNKM